MQYIERHLEPRLRGVLRRGRSVLLLGARQTGKTTLVERLQPDLLVNFIRPEIRQRYERSPELLAGEVEALAGRGRADRPLVALDEVQRVPELVNVVQDLIDRRVARFVLTGSSARKLRRARDTNWLPGRVIALRLDPLSLGEHPPDRLEDRLLDGSLPGLVTTPETTAREEELRSYATLYLEEEVRAEALVRNLGHFSRFLQLAALESGSIVHYRGLAQELGVAHTTVAGYFEILVDCLIAERVEPITQSRTRKKLTRSPRHIFFDLGVRRAIAEEGRRLPRDVLGRLFEQFVGLELIRAGRLAQPERSVRFFRDPDGPEVDWVVVSDDRYLPVEVKWTEAPTTADARHLHTFLAEHPAARQGLIVCRTPRRIRIAPKVLAIPWREIPEAVEELA
jgi:predicted AAA+ superfamily ATPase